MGDVLESPVHNSVCKYLPPVMLAGVVPSHRTPCSGAHKHGIGRARARARRGAKRQPRHQVVLLTATYICTLCHKSLRKISSCQRQNQLANTPAQYLHNKTPVFIATTCFTSLSSGLHRFYCFLALIDLFSA
jgi:hypothetical protein